MLKPLLLVFIFYFTSILHPIHVAVSEVMYNSRSKALEITHKIFIDDLEKHIESENAAAGKNISLKLNTSKENPEANKFIKDYIEKHFWVKVNKKPLGQIAFIGKEYETDAVWIYVEIQDVKSVKEIEITDNILFSYYEDQDNLVHITTGEGRRSLRFNPHNSTQTVQFR